MIEPSGSSQPSQPPNQPMRVEPVRVALRMPVTTPWVTYIILGVTIAVFLAQQASQAFLGGDIPAALGMKINEYIIQGQFWRLFTPALLHAGWVHIGFNMYALFSFGRGLERAYGHSRFFLLYLMGALAGNVASFWMSSNPSLGASTAIFGLVAAEGIYFYQNRKIYGSQARSVLQNVGFVIVINLFYGFTTTTIDNWGHLGGLIGGVVFAFLAGPIFEIEGFVPDLKLVDKRGPLLHWLVALVEGAGLMLIASFKIFSH
jgi:rhomboid protease GluP